MNGINDTSWNCQAGRLVDEQSERVGEIWDLDEWKPAIPARKPVLVIPTEGEREISL